MLMTAGKEKYSGIRNQDDKQGPGELANVRLDSKTKPATPGSSHLLQVYPADVGQSWLAGAARFY